MSKPLVSVIIATYLEENERFVQLALESIRRQTYKNLELVYVSSTRSIMDRSKEMGEIPVKHYHSQARMHYPEAVAKGYEKVSPESEFILLLNDDCFMADDCLEQLVRGMGDMEMILNPMSPCSVGMHYLANVGFFDKSGVFVPIKRQNKYEDLAGQETLIMEHSLRYDPMILFTQFSPFFCTLMRKTTWDKVGSIDPAFRTGQDDLDFAIRAQRHGIRCGTLTSAFCMHYSGRTATEVLTEEDRKFNREYFFRKHGFYPF